MLSLINNFWKLITDVWQFVDSKKILYNLSYGYLLLLIFCCINISLYSILEYILPYYFPKFNNLSYADRKYTVKNLSKSFILSIIMASVGPIIYNIISNGVWDNYYTYLFGTIYMSTDVTGLLIVPNLPLPTKIHHITVWIFCTLNMISNYEVNGLHRALVALGYFSSIPYLVNTYLGLRHLNSTYIKQKIVDISLYTYANTIVVNAILQHLYIFRWVTFNVISIVYTSLYYLILYDDIKLLRYLYYKYKNPTELIIHKNDQIISRDTIN
jgi:hypothetical protein